MRLIENSFKEKEWDSPDLHFDFLTPNVIDILRNSVSPIKFQTERYENLHRLKISTVTLHCMDKN